MDPAVLDLMLSGLPRRNDANLLVGFDDRDDATAYRLPSGEVIVQTVDFFTPVVDDPYDFGAIAAANSLSDIYAMNGRPLFALNICCFPKALPVELWNAVLRGGAEKAIEAGIAIAGGHTIDDTEPKYGLVVTGIVDPDNYWSNNGAKPGDQLVLTKPLGTGIVTTALKNEILTAQECTDVIAAMKQLNRDAANALSRHKLRAVTDITGNGFLGHAAEMARASKVGMVMDSRSVPVFPAAIPLAKQGRVPGGTRSNKLYLGDYVSFSEGVAEECKWLLYDAQTSGGLLCAIPQGDFDAAMRSLNEANVLASHVGAIVEGEGIVVR